MMTKTQINFISATDARKDWSQLFDRVVREKPQFIRRTRDNVMMTDINLIKLLLEAYTFTASRYVEEDGSITLSLNEMDLVENGVTEREARQKLAEAIKEYADDYYNEFHYWSSAPNRKHHIPYVLKALISEDIKEIGDSIQCQNGKN